MTRASLERSSRRNKGSSTQRLARPIAELLAVVSTLDREDGEVLRVKLTPEPASEKRILTHLSGPKVPSYPPPDRAPDATRTVQTTMETAHIYRLNGDYNPLHADPEPGKKMGFGGPIIHGLFSWNMSAHAILQAFGASKPENLKEFQARFAAPVKPADKLITEMWRTGEKVEGGFEEIRFIVRVEGGKTVLTNGRAIVKVEGQIKAKL